LVTGEEVGRILSRLNSDITSEDTAVELSVAVEAHIAQEVIAAVRAELKGIGEREEVRMADLEGAMQRAIRQAGVGCLEAVLGSVGTGYVGPTRPCECGAAQVTDHYAVGTWQTLLGTVTLRRAAYTCATCHAHTIPLDRHLGLADDRTSPLLRGLLSRYCATVPFAEACTLLAAATGLDVSPKRAQLVSEALGTRLEQHQAAAAVPPVCGPARLYLGIDGVLYCTTERDAAKTLLWREAKVGVIFTALARGAPTTGRISHLAPTGPAVDVADPQSHSYAVHMGDGQSFAAKLWQELVRRGIEGVDEIILLSDGAEWIETVRDVILRGLNARVVHILDFRHAQEHLWEVARTCLGDDAAGWIRAPLDHLEQGHIDDLLTVIQTLPTVTVEAAEAIRTTSAYFAKRRAMLDYPRFRSRGYQIGSGLAESACKRLVSQREKAAGMHWTVPGAQAIATLRAAHLSDRWQEVVDLACTA
jgi:hypothetical protein